VKLASHSVRAKLLKLLNAPKLKLHPRKAKNCFRRTWPGLVAGGSPGVPDGPTPEPLERSSSFRRRMPFSAAR
jgi:hypothetical protein